MRAAIASDNAPKYERRPVGSIVDAARGQDPRATGVDAWMPATVIADRNGRTRGITVSKEQVAELRPTYLPPDPTSRASYEVGDIAQCDLWFPPT